MLVILYDIHGNLPALEAVLTDAEGADAYLLGGDYGTPSPWPRETLDRLRTLEPATWIRGNGERWIFEPPADRPEVGETYREYMPGPLTEDEARCGDLHDKTIVSGHSHLQFRRDGPNGNHLLNPGSVGMPLDGDIRAAWAARNDGEFEFRRTEYDIERAAAGWRKLGGDFGSFAAQRIERGRD